MTASLFDTGKLPPVNSLGEPERMALVDSCKRTCAKEARAAARDNPAHEFEDLEQEAFVACVEASRRWSPTAGTKFNTYATACIRRHLANVTTSHRGEGIVHIESLDDLSAPDRREALEPDELAPMSRGLAQIIEHLEADEHERFPFTDSQAEAVARLGEAAKAVITLLMVYRFTTEQVAEQIGRPVKDVKLIARNAAKALPRELARAAAPNLFTEVA